MKKNHAIRTVRFDFEFERQSSAGTFLETIGNIFQTEIAPQIEKIFDRYDKTGGMLSLDSLELDLGAVEEDQLYDTLRTEIPRLLDKLLSGMELGEETPESGILRLFGADSHQDIPFSMHTEQAYPLELIRIFLQTGLLPPSVSLERGALEKLIDEVLEQEPEKLKELLSAKGQGIRPERLAWNISPAQRQKIEALTGLAFPEWTGETADGGRRAEGRRTGGRWTADGGREDGGRGTEERRTADGGRGTADGGRRDWGS